MFPPCLFAVQAAGSGSSRPAVERHAFTLPPRLTVDEGGGCPRGAQVLTVHHRPWALSGYNLDVLHRKPQTGRRRHL